METQKISVGIDRRIETGPLKVNDDWTGLFIRGDDCAGILALAEVIGPKLAFERLRDLMAETRET